MTEQLVFDLPTRTALGREDFFVSPANATALAGVERWRDWPQGRTILVGAAGAGKTHLAHVWAAAAGGQVLAAASLAATDVSRIADSGPICIENADKGVDEEALFHLHNLIAERGHALLLTATMAPARWTIALPDLRSRLTAIPMLTLQAPDDALLQAVLVKQFADRQISVAPDLIKYLLPRIERSFDAARRLVAELDTAAMAAGVPVNRAFAARHLDNSGTRGA